MKNFLKDYTAVRKYELARHFGWFFFASEVLVSLVFFLYSPFASMWVTTLVYAIVCIAILVEFGECIKVLKGRIADYSDKVIRVINYINDVILYLALIEGTEALWTVPERSGFDYPLWYSIVMSACLASLLVSMVLCSYKKQKEK